MTASGRADRTENDDVVAELGAQLLQRMSPGRPHVFDTGTWDGRVLDRAMSDAAFRTGLFRFAEVLPVLTEDAEVLHHARAYLQTGPFEVRHVLELQGPAGSGERETKRLAQALREKTQGLAAHFIAGPTLEEALPNLERLHKDGFALIVDLLGEATLSNAEGDAYRDRYLDLLDRLPAALASWPLDETTARDRSDSSPCCNVSLKLSALEPHLDPVDPAGSVERLKLRLLPVLLKARESGVSLHLDLEHWETHGIALDLFETVARDPELRNWPHLGITVQSYLKEARSDLERLVDLARSRGTPLGVRLVKGAYWESEVARSRRDGTPCPVYEDKSATDAAFEALTRFLLEHVEWLRPAFASHNLRSIAHALVTAGQLGLPREAVEVQTLQGMAEPERAALRDLGCRVAVYAPVGKMLPGMPYLVRRLLENTSGVGFLRLLHRDGAKPEALFARPGAGDAEPASPVFPVSKAEPEDGLDSPFVNCPRTDFADRTARERFATAVRRAGTDLPQRVPVVVTGSARHVGDLLPHHCPSRSQEVVSEVVPAGDEEVERALAAATAAVSHWRQTPLLYRAGLLEKLGQSLQADRDGLAALQVFESGKPWREADADVAEAVDFCRYYARRGLVELAPQPMAAPPGENNYLIYEGRGPAAVIAPWNFPLAILTGMTAAALVAGNPVLLKPAEQSSATGYALFRHLMAAGFPADVVQFLPGRGEAVGSRLVADPRVATIAFTGSKTVGLEILARAGRTQPGQPEVKRVVCEMGGKNAVVVDEDADLDAAVQGVVISAFGYAGQKCSAASRVIPVGRVAKPFVRRLVEAVKSLQPSAADDPACQLGPLIDHQAWERVRGVIDDPGPGAELLYRGEPPRDGTFAGPAVFRVRDPCHRLMQEEVFGPVLAVHPVDTFALALEVAVGTGYALTGGVYSRDPSHLALAERRFRVGNLYLNRACTGSVVGRQPFGGIGMSGVGSKAGGPGYLLQFSETRCVSENSMRHGFAPELQI